MQNFRSEMRGDKELDALLNSICDKGVGLVDVHKDNKEDQAGDEL